MGGKFVSVTVGQHMARTSKQDWLEAGLQILATEGAPTLTIERLTAALSLSKGSFYHHFQGLPGYKAALLEFIEQQSIERMRAVTTLAVTPVAGMAQLFVSSVTEPPELEVALRAWALQDREVREVQARIDEQRLACARSLCSQLLGDDRRVQLMSRMVQALMIGSTQFQPPLPQPVRHQLFAEFMRLYELADGFQQSYTYV